MASNNLNDLNDMLFNQLCRLDKDGISNSELRKEVARAKAMNAISSTIVNNARVVLAASKFMDDHEDPNTKLPRMIRVDSQDEEKQKRLEQKLTH